MIITRIALLKTLSTFLFVFLSFPSYALAQDSDYFVVEERTKLDAVTEREVTIVQGSDATDYQLPTLENLSKLYWKLGAFDKQDITAIDHYMLINECEIYQNFVDDDIEWLGIRKQAIKTIEKEIAESSNKFKFLVPVLLGSYNAQRGGFELVDNTGFPALKRLEFLAPISRKKVCEEYINVPNYHKDLMLIFDKPFDFKFLELDHHVAQAFILRHKEKLDSTGAGYAEPKRKAYVRIHMDIEQYNGVITRGTSGTLSVLYGKIQGLDIFEDQDQRILLQSYGYDGDELKPVKQIAQETLGE